MHVQQVSTFALNTNLRSESVKRRCHLLTNGSISLEFILIVSFIGGDNTSASPSLSSISVEFLFEWLIELPSISLILVINFSAVAWSIPPLVTLLVVLRDADLLLLLRYEYINVRVHKAASTRKSVATRKKLSLLVRLEDIGMARVVFQW